MHTKHSEKDKELVNILKEVPLFFKTPPILPTPPFSWEKLGGGGFQPCYEDEALCNNHQQFPTITYFLSQRAPS